MNPLDFKIKAYDDKSFRVSVISCIMFMKNCRFIHSLDSSLEKFFMLLFQVQIETKDNTYNVG